MHIAQNALNRYGYRLTAQEIVLLACPALPRWPAGTTEPARTAAERAKAARQAPRVTGDERAILNEGRMVYRLLFNKMLILWSCFVAY